MSERVRKSAIYRSGTGFGTLALTGAYGAIDDAASVRVIRSAVETGTIMVDTADFFAGGRVERLVGRAIAGRRDGVVLATRGGMRLDDGGRPIGVDADPRNLRRACEASLRRLGVDCIDLYHLARVDPRRPVEESVGALAELVTAGKIRQIGLTGASAGQLRRAHAVHPISALAVEYSLWERSAELDRLPVARELGVPLIACRPLGRGFLTGAITSVDRLAQGDLRRSDPRFHHGNIEPNRQLLWAARDVAARLDIGFARLALAWLLSQGPGVLPVPSTRNPVHVEMNAAQVDLTAEDREALRLLFSPGAVAGRAPAFGAP
ncbi:aldo/keto reductase [Actinomadura craniellae]|uniref:Aldo/keto reductase n=1 Tax=Actinomadura craniellae TaxID=2231787 RepID=A0A365H0T3_9ACTN|nr:aldo/keto reductase [Actinomadura craniellae]RAY12687.1 aldo/keto reductase [Actinomadura craniellae]